MERKPQRRSVSEPGDWVFEQVRNLPPETAIEIYSQLVSPIAFPDSVLPELLKNVTLDRALLAR